MAFAVQLAPHQVVRVHRLAHAERPQVVEQVFFLASVAERHLLLHGARMLVLLQ